MVIQCDIGNAAMDCNLVMYNSLIHCNGLIDAVFLSTAFHTLGFSNGSFSRDFNVSLINVHYNSDRTLRISELLGVRSNPPWLHCK